jgi:hypothetical protein
MNKFYSSIAAVALVIVCYYCARFPKLSPAERAQIASRFKFSRHPVAEPQNAPAHKTVRAVHPSLQRISAWISSVGAAGTLADLDRDGLPNDIVLVDPRTDSVTVSCAPTTPNRYPPFALSSATWSEGYDAGTIAPTGSLVGDFNDDGRLDILVYFWGRTPLIYYRSDDEGAPSAARYVPKELTTSHERWFTDCALQSDLDGDGRLDILFGNYFPDGSRVLDPNATGIQTLHEGKAKALNGGLKHIFLRQSSKAGHHVEFREVTNVFPGEISRGWAVAIGAADLDGDLLPELYFSHDFGPDRLLHNRSTPGKLSFVELHGERHLLTPKSCVLGEDSFKGMGCDFADINGDGFLDIYVSNIAAKFALMESHFLWQSTGHTELMRKGIAPYFQNSEKLGLSRSGFGWDCRLADFDNDGILEAIQACGFIKGVINRWPELQALGTSNNKIVHNPKFWPSFKPGADLSGKDCNPFFVRAADGRYYDIAPDLNMREAQVTRGLAIADVDHDGRLDFLCANQWGESYLFRNNAAGVGAFLGLTLLNENGVPAIGATATVVTADGRRLFGFVDGGSGHSGKRSPEIHFGLGKADTSRPVEVSLRWRDGAGKVQTSETRLAPGWHTIKLPELSASKLAIK